MRRGEQLSGARVRGASAARGIVRERVGVPPARPERPGRDAVPRVRPPDAAGARRLARDLETAVTGEVRFDAGSRAVYATDLSMYRQVPIGVVVPRDADDVVRALAVCRVHAVPVLGRGCGTSLAGQCCNVAVVFDFSKYMNRLLEKAVSRAHPSRSRTCSPLTPGGWFAFSATANLGNRSRETGGS